MRAGVVGVVVAALLLAAGCGGSGTSGKASGTAKDAIYNAGYQLDGKVKCSEVETQSSSAAHRYACHAGVIDGGVTRQVTIVVQCVDGAKACTTVAT